LQPLAKRMGILMLLLILPAAQAGAKAAAASKENLDTGRISEEPLRGVVINRTITVMGWDFYQYFTAAWRAKHMNEEFSITVYERPTARWGSEIWVDYDQKRVYHIFLAPARSAIKDISAQAVDIVYKNVVDINVQRLLFSDIDLGPEEM